MPLPVNYDHAVAYASDDIVKDDLELVCTRCPLEDNPVLCDVQADDSLQVLMDVFKSHWDNTHADEEID